uniref:Deoxyphypusine synthase (Fragments) n=1 Tax=Rattus norvegicus TaxID=10116 RepID=Q7M044_RAT
GVDYHALLEAYGTEINNPESVYYYAHNHIPVNPGLVLDIVEENGADYAVYINTAQEG